MESKGNRIDEKKYLFWNGMSKYMRRKVHEAKKKIDRKIEFE